MIVTLASLAPWRLLITDSWGSSIQGAVSQDGKEEEREGAGGVREEGGAGGEPLLPAGEEGGRGARRGGHLR